MASEELIIKIGSDVQGLQKGLEEIKKGLAQTANAAENAGKTSSTAFDVLKGVLGANIIQAGLNAVVTGLKDFARNALEAEEAENRLSFALQSSGKFTADAAKAFNDYTEELENTTSFSQEQIQVSASLLESIGRLSEDGLRVAEKAALDLSTALGKDLSTTSEALGRAASGNFRIIKQLGIEFQETGDHAKDFNTILGIINDRFGGAAEQKVQTFGGALQQAGNILGNVGEEIGKAIINTPELTAVLQVVVGVAKDLVAVIKENSGAISEFVGGSVSLAVTAVSGLAQALGFTLDILTPIINAFQDLTGATIRFAGVLIEIPKALIAASAGIAQLFGASTQGFEDLFVTLDQAQKKLESFGVALQADAQSQESATQRSALAIGKFGQDIQASYDQRLAAKIAANQKELDEENKFQTERTKILTDAQRKELENKIAISAEEDAFAIQKRQLEIQASDLSTEEKLLAETALQQALIEIKRNAELEKNALTKTGTDRELADLKAKNTAIIETEKLTNKTREQNKKDELERQKLVLASTAAFIQTGLAIARDGSAAQKALNVASAIQSTYTAATMALKNPPGPPFTIPLAAAAVGLGLANVAKITAAADGGLVTRGILGKDTEPFMLAKNEFVVPSRNYEQQIEMEAQKRGYVKMGDSNTSNNQTINVKVEAIPLTDGFVDLMAEKLRDAVQFRGANLGVT